MPVDPRYPIGPFSFAAAVDPAERPRRLHELEELPARLRAAVGAAAEGDLARTYRPGGWTVRQVVHHVADSHLNGYTRWKLALTEDEPTIRPYDEAAWARLGDVAATPLEVSLTLLEVLHRRWAALVRSLDESAFRRAYRHPENGLVPLEVSLANYAWHGRHHTAHVHLALGSEAFG